MKWLKRNNTGEFFSSDCGRYDLIKCHGYWLAIDWVRGKVFRNESKKIAIYQVYLDFIFKETN